MDLTDIEASYARDLGGSFNLEEDVLTDHHDERAHVFLALEEGVAVGTVRVLWGGDGDFGGEHNAQLQIEQFLDACALRQIAIADRLAVDPGKRGGYVTQVMLHVVTGYLAELDVALVLMDCEPHLVHTYLGLGFVPYGEPFQHSESVLLIPMAGVFSDQEHLQRLRVPFTERVVRVHDAELSARIRETLTLGGAIRTGFMDRDRTTAIALECRNLGPEWELLLASDAFMGAVARSLRVELRPGSLLAAGGRGNRTIYLVLAGSVSVVQGGRTISRNGPGTFCGDATYFLGRNPLGDMVAGEDGATVLGFHTTMLRELEQGDPASSARLLGIVARDLARKLSDWQAAVDSLSR